MGAPESLAMSSNAAGALPSGSLVRRSAARNAILEAGRRVLARDGVSEFSLSTVALEAGFGPSTVFGHFRNKDELLVAIVAEDLAKLAGAMQEGDSGRASAAEPTAHDPHSSNIDLTEHFDTAHA